MIVEEKREIMTENKEVLSVSLPDVCNFVENRALRDCIIYHY